MKNTLLSKAVKKILTSEAKPLSVPDLLKLLIKEGFQPNKTTLYRLLEKMKKERLIEEVLLNSKTNYYEMITQHHHHFTCVSCDQIKCIDDSELEKSIRKLESKLSKQGILIEGHHFSLTGFCESCILNYES